MSYPQPMQTFTLPMSDKIICYGEKGPKTYRDLLNDMETTKTWLSGKKSIGLFLEDSYDFTLVLLTCLHLGVDVVMPSNSSEENIKRILPLVDMMIDTQTFSKNSTTPTQQASDSASLNLSTHISLMTSGSSGEPKTITKQAHQLFSEAQVLEQVFQPQTQSIYSTVPHFHIYGLLFKVIWPITQHRAFNRECSFGLDDFQKVIQKDLGYQVITCPAHLKRLPDFFSDSQENMPFSLFISSGGACPSKTLAWWEGMNFPIHEVFGSTETGGIAWRKNGHIDSKWTALPQVQLRKTNDGTLSIQSPFTGENDWVDMSDRVSLSDDQQSFIFQGRADRIVKIEEKRLSLPEMETKLLESDLIEDAHIFLQPSQKDLQHPVLCGVVQLKTPAIQTYYNTGHRAFFLNLTKYLEQSFERVSIPKYWRVVSSIPTNSMGKRSLDAVRYLFEAPFQDHKFKPFLLSKEGSNPISLQFELPFHLEYFKGHFPNYPVLAGVVQVDWAKHYAREFLNLSSPIHQIHKLKFKSILQPGQKVYLELKYDDVKQRVLFKFHSGQDLYSSGTLCYTT